MTKDLSRRGVLAAMPLAASALALSSLPNGIRAATPNQAKRVLAVITSTARKPDGRPTGLWLSELASPYWALVDAGFTVDMVSILGGTPPIDPRSMTGPRGRGPSVERFEAASDVRARFQATSQLTQNSGDGYDAVFLTGGHGTMWDFRESEALRAVVERAWQRGATVAAVCHGPAGLLAAVDETGAPIVRGRRVTGFTNAEEDAVQLTQSLPYLLETELDRLGGHFESAANFQPNVIVDGRLITGQNPASAGPIGGALVSALRNE
jgi:putative intracellular protease/amidase